MNAGTLFFEKLKRVVFYDVAYKLAAFCLLLRQLSSVSCGKQEPKNVAAGSGEGNFESTSAMNRAVWIRQRHALSVQSL